MRTAVVIIPALCAVLLGLFVFIRYRRRLNAAVSEDSTPTDREHRSTSPSEAIPWILIAVLVIWNAVSLTKISTMNLKIDSLVTNTSSLMNQMWAMSSKIDELEEQLKAETELLHEYDWSFAAFDGTTGRVRMDFTLAPNTYSEKSEFSLQFGEEKAACTQVSDGRYIASLYLDVFKAVDSAPVLTLTEDGVTRTQILDDVPYGEMWALVFPYYDTEGADLKASLKNGTLSLKGSFAIGDFSKSVCDLKVTKTEIVKEVDGKEVGRIPVDLSGKNFEPVKIEIDDKFENFSSGSRLRLYLDVKTDSDYAMTVELCRVSAEGDFAPQMQSGVFEIFDPSGKTVVNHKN
ncbi:MAG: DUF4320 family protein [Lachnospiraceae bacterium]|nr:DUF4320 family protein [Lachnospiraceae bacterium]